MDIFVETKDNYIKHFWLVTFLLFDLTFYLLKTIILLCPADFTLVNTRYIEENKAFVFIELLFYWPIPQNNYIISLY